MRNTLFDATQTTTVGGGMSEYTSTRGYAYVAL